MHCDYEFIDEKGPGPDVQVICRRFDPSAILCADCGVSLCFQHQFNGRCWECDQDHEQKEHAALILADMHSALAIRHNEFADFVFSTMRRISEELSIPDATAGDYRRLA